MASSPFVDIYAWRHGITLANGENLLQGGGPYPDSVVHKTNLTAEGEKEAEKLGQWIVQRGGIDVIYTSDLNRALQTATKVQEALKKSSGKVVELLKSPQLREIFHGKYEMTSVKVRDDAGYSRLCKLAESAEKTLDRFRFCKIHPQAQDNEIVQEDIIEGAKYLGKGAETPYKLWLRLNKEFERIALANPGKRVGISMHGASLVTLINGLQGEGYIPPHYLRRPIKVKDKIVVPVSTTVKNCQLVHFKFYTQQHKLGLCELDL